jgi:hypothetical protein
VEAQAAAVTPRSKHGALGTAVLDYLRRIWHHSAEDDLLFLASGVAFGLLLAALPFALLVMSGLAFVVNDTPERTAITVHHLLDQLLPRHSSSTEESLHQLIDGVLKSRGALGFWGAFAYFWFTARLFGALRSALSQVLDFGTHRGMVAGKLFDFRLTVMATFLVTGYLALTVYVAIATSRGVRFLTSLGLRTEVMGGLEYAIGRLPRVHPDRRTHLPDVPVRPDPRRANQGSTGWRCDGVHRVRAHARGVCGGDGSAVTGDHLYRHVVHDCLRGILGLLRGDHFSDWR